MDLEIHNILNKIEDNGYEAYIIGGYVRDYILGIKSLDIDIGTNALPKDIMRIFDIKADISSYGSVRIKTNTYNVDITTYRKEENYQNRRPQKVTYINNLLDDINRRDFTINSLCMNKDGIIFDYLNGISDINKKVIRVIGPLEKKLTDDPLRILRAIRFASILNFKLENSLYIFIKNNPNLVKNLSYYRKKEELDKMFSSKNLEVALKLLKDLDLLDALEINYDKIIGVSDLLGIWVQIDFSPNYPFTKDNLKRINTIRNIIKNGFIDNKTLFNEGLFLNLVAADILKIDKQDVYNMYYQLPIKSKKELVINNKDIMEILNIMPSDKLNNIYNDILDKVLFNKLENNYQVIIDYLLKNWK